ncbi:J domain-containing protein [Noviherbaspirillum cavernae]|uniref:J domain-containing protein n=1 Tax=Noviherbaspirillum cavernae TaxID=2320862 RepID=UPI0013143B8E|nr:J domain-containing protein [Noviherbaspirillum cavernae]
MATPDYYSVLGILPDAEDVVVAAAYRALAQRYHPDRWTGNPTEAHGKMSVLNEAYRVLRDKTLRAEYDRARVKGQQAEFSSEESSEFTEAFASGLSEVEDRWLVACSIYPDLVGLRKKLGAVSTSLAFSYVTAILEIKMYEQRNEIAEALKSAFLERYFGTNAEILKYAEELIYSGHRDAAKALNRLVDVMGSNVEPSRLISKVDTDFGIRTSREREAAARQRQRDHQSLASAVRVYGHYREARALADLHGYQTQEVGGGFLSAPEVHVKPPKGDLVIFKNSVAFVQWVKNTLLPAA